MDITKYENLLSDCKISRDLNWKKYMLLRSAILNKLIFADLIKICSEMEGQDIEGLKKIKEKFNIKTMIWKDEHDYAMEIKEKLIKVFDIMSDEEIISFSKKIKE